jgi:hypothetical protein
MRWYAMSTRFLTDPKVEKLGERHGPAGPLIIVSLLSHAGQQESGGAVERTFRATAHETFVDRKVVESVLDDAIELGLCHAVSRDVSGFVVEFPAWKRHQAAFRKARSREARKGDEKPYDRANVTGSHAVSQKVTNKTRQNKTEKKNVPPPKEEAPLSYLLAELIVANGSRTPTVSREWAVEEDRMLRLDKRPQAEAEKLIRWCQTSSFWRAVVQSMPKFREKYDTMRLQAIEQAGGTVTKAPRTDRSAYSRVEAA